MPKITCLICEIEITKKMSDALNPKTGRPWKHNFCSKEHYLRWRADRHLAVKKKWLQFQREIWGTTEIGRFNVAKAKPFGRIGEIIARDKHLPANGFTDIADFSGHSNQFFIDFIATYQRHRVLVDATIKLKAYIPEKTRLAAALGMRLFIIHVAIINPSIYFLHEVPVTCRQTRVPAAFIRELAAKKGLGDGPIMPH
jgi:hypothetical protein